MSLPCYSEYKTSGVEWLGEVPGHWRVDRFKAVLDLKKDTVGEKSSDFMLLSLTLQGVIPRDLENPFGKFPAEFDTYQAVKKGDIIFCLFDVEETPRAVGLAEQDGMVTGAYTVTTVKEGSTPRYLYYFYLSRDQYKAFKMYYTGLRNVIRKDTFFSIPCPIPPLAEQKTIAAFLDRETGKIDELIAEQRRLVELLAEKRQAVISHAVTKGLNPNAKMKDSGIEWLGEVPEHWVVCAIKRMTLQITDGAHISPETDEGIYDFVSTKDVSDSGIDFESCLKTSPSSYEYLVRSGCQPARGDVLFSKDGTIGRTVVVKEDREFVVASSLIIIRPDSVVLDSTFLHYLCRSFLVIQQVEGFVKGAGLPRLSIQNLLKVFGVFPQLEEQQAIAAYLDTETAKFDTLTAEANRAIELLQERRSALISAAVTGKIDVRGKV